MPLVALEEAGNDTARAPSGAKRAKTGTPFFGYIIAATLVNTDFGDFFHNQIATAWLAFLNAVFFMGHEHVYWRRVRRFSASGAGYILNLIANGMSS